ncbi:uncharacterized protein B0H18DRAFT_130747 [Fomitopsis serialis]|uniref:uncharacterized protein n=1 Tax=Fomitopsis serialis TaxID=139415 RepID=UPI002007C6C8|nr:uncharacterized protein B0H18DRAFT_130747 [Neoantrodia serialis]KAH9930643.1 hypothetical protein B0H18DRAFT_130747 [Neoantrodia serialis]
MLFHFASSDVYETTITDAVTGAVAFRTLTCRPQRQRSGTWSSTSTASSSSSRVDVANDQHMTFIEDGEGRIVAEITWKGTTASHIRIGDNEINGTIELFDSAFVKILPDETLLPTRYEYTWRMTPDSLSLLDDDDEVIGGLYQNHVYLPEEKKLAPATSSRVGGDYLDLGNLPEDEMLEMLVCYLLLSSLRDRMYSITKYVYGSQKKNPLSRFGRRAKRSIASLRNTIRRPSGTS